MRAQAIGVTALVVLLAAACRTSPLSQQDVEVYLQQLRRWAPQEGEIARAVRRILETEFVDEAEVRRQITESTPRLEAHVVALRSYQPRPAELRDLHGRYRRTWEGLQDGYADILRGLDTANQPVIGRGRRALLAWREAIPATARRLLELRDASVSTMEQGPPT